MTAEQLLSEVGLTRLFAVECGKEKGGGMHPEMESVLNDLRRRMEGNHVGEQFRLSVRTEAAAILKAGGIEGAADLAEAACRAAERIRPKRREESWPELAPEALHGVAGDFVRIVEPHSESDPVALLLQFLAAMGNLIGRGPHFTAEADEHHLNLFVVMVGRTAKSRKGSSWGHVKRAAVGADSSFLERMHPGLSSGEGLIWAVRDEIEEMRKGELTVTDAGVLDKRLMVTQAEFASVLRVLGRDGNTLSAILREAWDGGRLESLTKNAKAKATGAHISIVGHITRDELLTYLTATEAANGFGNRIVWALVKRSKVLPEGGNLDPAEFLPLVQRIRLAVNLARGIGELKRDATARAIWIEVYPELSEGKPGLLGAMIARAEAQVMRIASLYAVLDGESVIRADHLNAALAVWDYAQASARIIFGERLGNETADAIAEALLESPEGLTRSDLVDLFHRHVSRARMDRAIALLIEHDLIRISRDTDTGGRPADRLFHVRSCEKSEKSEKTTPGGGLNSLNSLNSQYRGVERK